MVDAEAQMKTPRGIAAPGRWYASLTMSYFRGKYIPLSSALSRFTVLFGMGRGGSNSLWSSGNRVDLLRSHRQATAVKRSNRKKQRPRVA